MKLEGCACEMNPMLVDCWPSGFNLLCLVIYDLIIPIFVAICLDGLFRHYYSYSIRKMDYRINLQKNSMQLLFP